jgi:hypothetical protein
MPYIGLALFAEGATDYRFLSPLLLRAVTYLCLKHGQTRIDVGDVIPLDAPGDYRDEKRAVRIREAAKQAWGGFHLLFVHSDGSNDSDRVRDEQVNPGLDEIKELAGTEPYAGVAVVPVRETEAWILCDGNALRVAFQTSLTDEQMNLPRPPREAERDLDPKRTLRDAYLEVVGGASRARGRSVVSFFPLLGETVDLARLEQLPSFKRFLADLHTALMRLGVIQ